jgi:hypothetical protein
VRTYEVDNEARERAIGLPPWPESKKRLGWPLLEHGTYGSGLIHRSAWKKNSAKFAVANGSPTHRQALVNRLCRTRLASKCGDFAPFVAPMCIKGLRLVTMQLPEKFWPSKQGLGELRQDEVLGSLRLQPVWVSRG